MLIITIRTEKPDAEIGVYEDNRQLAYKVWTAHRTLAETLHSELAALLKTQHKTLHDIQGIVAFQGPGSFTGLRIGLTVANTLAYSLQVPIASTTDPDWLENGIAALLAGKGEQVVQPEYGSAPHITAPKH